jgi:protein-tyrosine phosphatase
VGVSDAAKMTEAELPRILVVCTANITRSPIAELLLDAYFRRHLPEWQWPVVSSAGSHARPGLPADPPMAAVARSWRLEPDEHSSRRVTREVATENDLIITMELRHQQVVARLGPRLAERTFRFTELAELLDAADPGVLAASVDEAASGRDRLRVVTSTVHALRARSVIAVSDVADPHGGPDGPYTDTARELAGLVERVGVVLARSLGDRDD